MPGIKSKMMVHSLNVDPTHRLVNQKKRSLALKRQKAIVKEVNKLTNAEFIREVNYLN